MAKRVKSTKPKKIAKGASVFDDRQRLEDMKVWIWTHYCSRCGDYSKKTQYCTQCENRAG